jgi:serine/threonine protein kinase
VKEPSFGQLAKRLEQRLEQRGASTWRSLGAAEESSEPVESTPSLQLEAQPASTGFEVGAVLCERFRIERCVLRGEGEEWFSAFDLMLEESVSLQRCIGVDAATQKRVLRRQLELARRSRSAHVCRVHDYAVWRGRTPEDDVPFLTAEPLSGENLSQRVFRGALPWAELRPIAEQILLALIDLHAAGLAHGALCARNVWLREDRDGPCVVLYDFSRAALLDCERPLSAEPSLALSSKPSVHADLSAFNHLLFQMLTGRSPWPGEARRIEAVPVAGDAATALQQLPALSEAILGTEIDPTKAVSESTRRAGPLAWVVDAARVGRQFGALVVAQLRADAERPRSSVGVRVRRLFQHPHWASLRAR